MVEGASAGARAELGSSPGPRTDDPDPASSVSTLIKVADVAPLSGRRLRLWFSDGAVLDVDLEGVLAAGGMFEPVRDQRDLFEQVRVNPETGTIEWPGEIDLDAEVLYGRREPASGVVIGREPARSL